MSQDKLNDEFHQKIAVVCSLPKDKQKSYMPALEKLLKAGASANACMGGSGQHCYVKFDPLKHAIQNDSVDVVRLVKKYMTDDVAQCMITEAVKKGQHEIATILSGLELDDDAPAAACCAMSQAKTYADAETQTALTNDTITAFEISYDVVLGDAAHIS